MDGYISFSQLNDFVFCPHSLFIHSLYNKYKTSIYHDTPQVNGKAAHETIDQSSYKRAGWLTGVWLCSPTYKVYGKCDLYNSRTGILAERKRTIHKLYDGQKLQIYAQALCLKEMGKKVSLLILHSITDNKKYNIPFPDDKLHMLFITVIKKMLSYKAGEENTLPSSSKCTSCIYAPLCPIANLSKG